MKKLNAQENTPAGGQGKVEAGTVDINSRVEKAIDKGTGEAIRSRISIEDELAALREQIAAISDAGKVPFTPKFQALCDLVGEEVQKGKDMKKNKLP